MRVAVARRMTNCTIIPMMFSSSISYEVELLCTMAIYEEVYEL